MKTLNLKFEEKDFNSFKDFEKSVRKQVGNNVYIGTNSLCLYFDYPAGLVAMLRPLPRDVQLEFELTSSVPGGK